MIHQVQSFIDVMESYFSDNSTDDSPTITAYRKELHGRAVNLGPVIDEIIRQDREQKEAIKLLNDEIERLRGKIFVQGGF